jgi:short-subunit dehydrogenase
MKPHLKPLNEQAVVITGASSGIGLATAEAAAERGAKVVLVARSEHALQKLADRITEQGDTAVAVPCDVSDRRQVEQVANTAIAHFGRIDTWINNAGQGIYGRLDEVSEDDSRRLFDINFWGVVNGSLIALRHLRCHGGAIINVGSEVSEAYVPLLGMYTASKHAVKGFTDSLRVEIEDVDQAPVAITLIQPTAVDTPFPQHACNYQEQEPKLPSPMIAVKDVVEVILDAAVRPTRHRHVGIMSTINTTVSMLFPEIADRMAARYFDEQHYDEPPRVPAGILYQSSEDAGLVGQSRGTGGHEPT